MTDPTLKVARPEFQLGSGKASGVLAVFCGGLGLGAVVALHFPQYFATPGARAAYPMGMIRLLIDVVLLAGFVSGIIGLILARNKSRGFLGVGLVVLAELLGGSRVPLPESLPRTPFIALDNFLLSLFVLALVFVPLERAFRRREQRVFRPGWRADLMHFGVSHLLVQITVFLTMLPATVFFRWAVSDRFQAAVASQPVWLQFLEALFVADLFAYLAHRAFHEVPILWRFHQVHHSSRDLDWLAGSRLHIVDIVFTRAFAFLPLYVIGFADPALYAYVAWAAFQAVFIHANLRFTFGPLRYLLATPQFHHWHHSATLYDRNFAVHLPLIDKLFGTYHLPGNAWPERYGIEGDPVPDGYGPQLGYPFARRREAEGDAGEQS